MQISPAQLKEFLFPDLHSKYSAPNSIRIRAILDHHDVIYIPAWLATQIQDDESARQMFHIQIVEGHAFLWAAELWANSRDRRLAKIAQTKASIAVDLAAARAGEAQTKYQGECYAFVNKLAERIVDNYYPHMKKGFLKSTFQRILTDKQYDLARFREVLDESFDDQVLNVCWVNEPVKSNERPTNCEEDQAAQQDEEGCGNLSGAESDSDLEAPGQEGEVGSGDREAGSSGCSIPPEGEDDAAGDIHGAGEAAQDDELRTDC